jgi:hypothetical protein
MYSVLIFKAACDLCDTGDPISFSSFISFTLKLEGLIYQYPLFLVRFHKYSFAHMATGASVAVNSNLYTVHFHPKAPTYIYSTLIQEQQIISARGLRFAGSLQHTASKESRPTIKRRSKWPVGTANWKHNFVSDRRGIRNQIIQEGKRKGRLERNDLSGSKPRADGRWTGKARREKGARAY